MQDVQQVELEDTRRHDLDALRGFAMLLGIALHAALAYLGTGWAVVDSETSPLLGGLVSFVHGFRMPLFFVLSGFFTAMLFHKHGIGGLLRHRTRRILVPLAVCCLTIVPAMWIVVIAAASDNATYGVPESSQNLWTAAAAGDLVQVERFVAFGWPLDDVDPVFRQTPMAWAINHGHHEIVAQLLAAGADPNARYGQEELTSHLHSAAFFGRPECTRLLLEAEADPHARNEFGETPLDALRHAKGVVDLVAGIFRIEIDFDEVQLGRSEVAALLKSHGAISGLANDAASDGSGAATTARSNSGGTAVRAIVAGLMYFPFFHHLWFLWLLCWLIMGFALVAVALSTVPLRPKLPWWLVASPLALAWVVPLTALTQATMFSGTIVPGFGPDTSAGLLPMPNVLGYYAVFFAFGRWPSSCQVQRSAWATAGGFSSPRRSSCTRSQSRSRPWLRGGTRLLETSTLDACCLRLDSRCSAGS